MKIMILSAYFEPEIAASLYLFSNICEALVEAGHKVDVFTPVPTRGVSKSVTKEYKKIKKEKLMEGRLKIHRFWLPNERKSTVFRAIRYFCLNFVLFFKSLFFKTDVIFLASTPPTNGLMGGLLRKIKKVPVVYNLQDIFPDSLVNTGITSKKSLSYKFGKRIEQFTYKNVDQIIVISEDFKQNIINKGVPEEKINIVYNWVDETAVVPIDKSKNILFEQYNLNRELFYVVYAGNLGFAQNIEVILEVAKLLLDFTKIRFVIFGTGFQEQEYKKMALAMDLDNLIFLPIQPYSTVSYVYSLGDVCVVACKKGFGSSAMPSKTWSIMSAQRPILASFDKNSEMEKIIKNEEIGLFSESDDVIGFKDAILKLYQDETLCRRMGKNGRNYILNNISRKSGTKEILKIIENTVERNQYVQK